MLFPQSTITRVIGLVIFLGAVVITYLSTSGRRYHFDALRTSAINQGWNLIPQRRDSIAYKINTPLTVGCERVVTSLQLKLIESYSDLLKDIRYANLWGYLETENKGDAAIWAAQQMLLSTLGIQSMGSCRFLSKDCDVNEFKALLQWHYPHSAILMAGGGNFNDFYWEDQPSRIKMVQTFPNVSIRAFPQSIHMTHEGRIRQTKEAFGAHEDLQLAARDAKSYSWLQQEFKRSRVKISILPDIAFMWGNRPDIRLRVQKTHDILILARDDWEISAGNSSSIPWGTGTLPLSDTRNATYNKVDWKFTHTPGIDKKLPDFIIKHLKKTHQAELEKSDVYQATLAPSQEGNKNVRAQAKAIAGFELLSSAEFVITDRLHGHILSTVLGIPHVVMDSALGKNLDFVDTWTKDCKCVRVARDFKEALAIANMYLQKP